MVWRPALCHTATEYRSWDLHQLCLAPRTHWTHSSAGLLFLCLGKLGAKVGMEWGPGASYLQQGQGPCELDAKAAKRGAGGKDAGLVQHLVPEIGAGRRRKPSGAYSHGSPSYPRPTRQTAGPATLLTALTSGTAERDSGMCSGRRGAQTAAKTRQGDEWGHVGPHLDLYSHTPPGALTHEPLIDEVLSKVNQDQRDDVTLQALEEPEDITYVVGWETGTGHGRGRAPATVNTLNTVHFS